MKYVYYIIGLLFLVGVVFLIMSPGKPGQYDEFAQCLKDSGATFYGTFWCPHCQSQKALFGRSMKFVPYVECSTPDGRGQTSVCRDAGITSYPTWQFNSSTTDRMSGQLSLETLAEKTGCVLPNLN